MTFPFLAPEGGPVLTPYLVSVLFTWLLAVAVLSVDPMFRLTGGGRRRVAGYSCP